MAAGTKSSTKQLTTQGAATTTPGATAKTAVAAGRYTIRAVQVAGDANLKAGNIKNGVSIFGVMGELAISIYDYIGTSDYKNRVATSDNLSAEDYNRYLAFAVMADSVGTDIIKIGERWCGVLDGSSTYNFIDSIATYNKTAERLTVLIRQNNISSTTEKCRLYGIV